MDTVLALDFGTDIRASPYFLCGSLPTITTRIGVALDTPYPAIFIMFTSVILDRAFAFPGPIQGLSAMRVSAAAMTVQTIRSNAFFTVNSPREKR